jgi:hypothetical protein
MGLPMERSMNQVRVVEELSPSQEDSLATAKPEPYSEWVLEKIRAYLHSLGLSDPELMEQLAQASFDRALHRVGRGTEEELVRRSLEEILRRIDQALLRAVGGLPSWDEAPIATLRAAFLLNRDRFSADRLMQNANFSAEGLGEDLRKVLPHSVPPEAHLIMPEQPMRFWLFKSTHQSK